ncbi:hypothetical protein JCM19000A_31820 [Silvimonas sp. JCM 19000]
MKERLGTAAPLALWALLGTCASSPGWGMSCTSYFGDTTSFGGYIFRYPMPNIMRLAPDFPVGGHLPTVPGNPSAGKQWRIECNQPFYLAGIVRGQNASTTHTLSGVPGLSYTLYAGRDSAGNRVYFPGLVGQSSTGDPHNNQYANSLRFDSTAPDFMYAEFTKVDASLPTVVDLSRLRLGEFAACSTPVPDDSCTMIFTLDTPYLSTVVETYPTCVLKTNPVVVPLPDVHLLGSSSRGATFAFNIDMICSRGGSGVANQTSLRLDDTKTAPSVPATAPYITAWSSDGHNAGIGIEVSTRDGGQVLAMGTAYAVAQLQNGNTSIPLNATVIETGSNMSPPVPINVGSYSATATLTFTYE